MKKLFLIIALFSIACFAQAQIVKTIDLSTISGADTTFYFPLETCKYNTSLGLAVKVDSVTGSGTYEYLNSYSDSILLYNPLISYTIATDTIYAVSDVYIPFSYVGFKITKGTLSAGTITTIVERKTRK